MCVCVCVCVCACVCVCVCVSAAVYGKAQARRISNSEFKLWTIRQGTECVKTSKKYNIYERNVIWKDIIGKYIKYNKLYIYTTTIYRSYPKIETLRLS